MRVIGGEARGRRLVAPRLATLRPTSDRVREAMFDALEARRLVEGSIVLDLFAGSGALGIEALSRGAAAAFFVESDPRAARAVEANLAVLGPLAARGRLVRADVLGWLAGRPELRARGGPPPDPQPDRRPAPLVVALADPPYRFGAWDELLAGLVEVADVAMLEHAEPLELPSGYETLRTYRHGGTLLTLAVREPGVSGA